MRTENTLILGAFLYMNAYSFSVLFLMKLVIRLELWGLQAEKVHSIRNVRERNKNTDCLGEIPMGAENYITQDKMCYSIFEETL